MSMFRWQIKASGNLSHPGLAVRVLWECVLEAAQRGSSLGLLS
ncbi:MAG: hypothetical protein AB8B87_09820 [Granulosicoccus sp.]